MLPSSFHPYRSYSSLDSIRRDLLFIFFFILERDKTRFMVKFEFFYKMDICLFLKIDELESIEGCF